MDLALAGKVAVVTGASKGIGLAARARSSTRVRAWSPALAASRASSGSPA